MYGHVCKMDQESWSKILHDWILSEITRKRRSKNTRRKYTRKRRVGRIDKMGNKDAKNDYNKNLYVNRSEHKNMNKKGPSIISAERRKSAGG